MHQKWDAKTDIMYSERAESKVNWCRNDKVNKTKVGNVEEKSTLTNYIKTYGTLFIESYSVMSRFCIS